MASAFIIYILPELQKDSGDESTALLRILVYAGNNSAFGGDVPQVPTWTGPPTRVVWSLILLYFGLAATMAAVLFAILAKQMLGIYIKVYTSDSDVENGQSRELKPNWFTLAVHTAVLLLSAMVQFAIILDSAAVTVYLWEINRPIAGVVLFLTLGTVPLYFTFYALGATNIGFSYFWLFRKKNRK